MWRNLPPGQMQSKGNWTRLWTTAVPAILDSSSLI